MTFFNNLKSAVSLSPWLLLLFIDSHLELLSPVQISSYLPPKLGCQRVSVHHCYRLQRPEDFPVVSTVLARPIFAVACCIKAH